MECHRCSHRRAVQAGKYRNVAFEQTPCSQCELQEGARSGYEVPFDDGVKPWERSVLEDGDVLRCGVGGLRGLSSAVSLACEAVEEELLPVSVLGAFAAGMMRLRPENRDLVCWRFAGMEYDQIGRRLGVTAAAVEKRHRRVMKQWPVLQALFARKVARMQRGGNKGETSEEEAVGC